MKDWIPLLSVRPIEEFTPVEYRAYIKGLYFKKTKKKTPTKSKKKPYVARRTPKGKLSLQIRRNPPWLSDSELTEISLLTEIPLNVVFLKLKELGGIVSTSEEQTKIGTQVHFELAPKKSEEEE